jgi:hypothetical protein
MLKDLATPAADGQRIRRITYLGARSKGKQPEFCRVATATFSWANGRAREWRKKAAAFATMMRGSDAITEPTAAGMRERFGPRWFMQWGPEIEHMIRPWPRLTYRELRILSAASRAKASVLLSLVDKAKKRCCPTS